MEMGASSSRSDEEQVETWRQISAQVHRIRHTPFPTAANELLQDRLREAPDGPFAAAYQLWIGDNFFQEARFEEAIEAFEEVVRRYPESRLGPKPFAAVALRQAAAAHERLGHAEEAAATLGRIAEAFADATSAAWLLYEQGRIAEDAGNDREASAAYGRAAEAEDVPESLALGTKEVARRAAERIRSPGPGIRPHPEIVAMELARALERSDADVLEKLASPTHFTLGVLHSERHFIEREKVLAQLASDLRSSKVRVDPAALSGCGEKRYLATDGWVGEFLAGRVIFILTRARAGWEWSGVALTQLSETWEQFFEPFEKHENQPLTLSIKAPWPAGTSFRAGGLIGFSIQMGIFVAMGWPWGAIAMELASLNACGFGPGGLYYNQPTTHVGAEAFAVDFCKFQPGVPLLPTAAGTPVLAVADGLVTGVESVNPNGSSTSGNCVRLEHMTEAELFALFIIWLFTGTRMFMPFSSRVLHLAGPALIPVSFGMHVKQGARLGLIDDTGNSVADHLHFSISDRTLGGSPTFVGMSVRPTPMDGQTLNNADDGRCVFSTNVPIP